MNALRLLKLLWRNREVLLPLARLIEMLAKAGATMADVRARLADGIQRGDIVSDLALMRVVKAHARADAYTRGDR